MFKMENIYIFLYQSIINIIIIVITIKNHLSDILLFLIIITSSFVTNIVINNDQS